MSSDLRFLKKALQSRSSVGLTTNILKIALNQTEQKIASCLVAYYSCKLSEDMIDRAIKTNQMDFLYTVWGFGKNFSDAT